ncbi:MAG: LysR family transcriptional regulator [Clostridiales bacterium]|nr:LysR family transcriptional regulator [Clostridiales bacterium]
MNIMHVKYAYEVARAGSLSRASESLFVAVPNLSRSIKELEADLNITIFDRTAKGMQLTPAGEEFMDYAKRILTQIDQLERLYKGDVPKKQQFSISVPRASYIAEALAEFSKTLTKDGAELFYKETNSHRTIKNVLENDYKLGILRYAENYDVYFKTMLEEKNLNYEMVTEFTYRLVMSREHPLAGCGNITFDQLAEYIEVAHADPYVPSLPMSKVVKEELPDNINRRIFVFERASQFELLARNPETFMWVSPIPTSLLDRYQLVEKECVENTRRYKDVLIYRANYHLTELDRRFITELGAAKRKYL